MRKTVAAYRKQWGTIKHHIYVNIRVHVLVDVHVHVLTCFHVHDDNVVANRKP